MDEAGPSTQQPPLPSQDEPGVVPPPLAVAVADQSEAVIPTPPRRGAKRKVTPVDSRLPKRICIPKKPHRRWNVVFEPFTHWNFWTGAEDDDWAGLTSLDVFYHFRWPEPQEGVNPGFHRGF